MRYHPDHLGRMPVPDEYYSGSPLHVATRKNNLSHMESLIADNVDVNIKDNKIFGQTPMHLAAHNGSCAAMELLYRHKATLDIADEFNNDTPMHYAAAANKVEAIQWLIDHGAKIDTPNKNDLTPLDMAVENQCKEAIALLQRD